MGRHKTLKRDQIQHHNSRLADVLRIPEEVTKHEIKATITSNDRIWIENYRGLLEFTEERICLRGKKLCLIVEGRKLKIEYFTKEDMLIKGNVSNVKYELKKPEGKEEHG